MHQSTMNQVLRQAIRRAAIATLAGMVVGGCSYSGESPSPVAAAEGKELGGRAFSPATGLGKSGAFVVDTSAQRLLEAHKAAMLLLEREQSYRTICEAMVTASSAQAEVGRSLTSRLTRSFGQQVTGANAIKDLEALARHISARYPGVGLAVGAETVYHFVDYDALAKRSPPSVANMLAQAAKVWPAPAGRPIHWAQTSDVSVCTNPMVLAEALEGVLTYWRSAPGCAREQLAPALSEVVRDALQSRCFCADVDSSRKGLERLARTASAMSLQAGNDAGAEHGLTDTRFNCRPD